MSTLRCDMLKRLLAEGTSFRVSFRCLSVIIADDVVPKRRCDDEDREWHEALPYEGIPGPAPLPIVGNKWRAIPVIGDYDTCHIDVASKNLYDHYGPIVKVAKFMSGEDMVLIYEADDIEKLLRNEKTLPDRPLIPSLYYYKTVLRKDFFGNNLGVIGVDAESWSKFRPKVQKDMLQPKIARLYVSDIERSAGEFVERISTITDDKDEVPENFMNEINKWALESIGRVALDTRLGCLERVPPKDTQILLSAMKTFQMCTIVLEFKIPFWRMFSTPMWKKFVHSLDTFHRIIFGKVEEALRRGVGDKSHDELSLLERLLASNSDDPQVAISMAFDMFLVGIDTTSNAVASALYRLAKDQRVQQRVYEEITNVLPDSRSRLTAEKLENMPYLKAVLKETLRLAPPVIGNGRRLTSNTVINGYQIPKGTQVVFQCLISSSSEKYYKDSLQFIPERWLKQNTTKQCPYADNMKTHFHPFAFIPFGYGRRMCLGKRFADLEMQIVMCKILQTYKIDYEYGDLGYITEPLYALNGPLKFKFVKRKIV